MSIPEFKPHQCAEPNLLNIEVIRNQSELLRAECSRLISETDHQCKHMQNDHRKKLDQWVKDVQFLKTELELKLEETVVETDELITLQNRVVKALEAIKEPQRVTNLCLEERMKRLHPDRLHDEVDTELLNEKEVIEGVSSVLLHVTEQMTEQIRLNRAAKYTLEQDLKEKSEAQRIDSSCSLMTMQTVNKLSKNTSSLSSTVTPTQWENITDVNVGKAEKQKTNSAYLRTMVESLLEQTFADVQRQLRATTAAFQLKVQEVKSAKSQMEDQLAKIAPELSSQRSMRDDLKVAITETEHALNKAQARLGLRDQRPAKEQCRDPAQAQLLSEVQQLTASINRLREAVARSEEKQRALVRCQLELQKGIEVKSNHLYVDEVICSQQRESVVICNF